MSWKHLGEVFDIHGGGIDLVFPHHENEIAQTRCAFGHDVMANVWMHNGFLQVEGEKMSKSLGNFVTIHELLNTDRFGGLRWDGRVVRFAMLGTHYRQPIDWTVSKLVEATGALRKFSNFNRSKGSSKAVYPPLLEALSDDLNLPKAISELHTLANQMSGTSQIDGDAVERWAMFHNSLELLGLGNLENLGAGADPELFANERIQIESLIKTRLTARAAKNWGESDRIRDELAAMGVALKDNKDGTTTWEVKR
jgi:cysteinyl-tRNA synthetase